MLNHASCLMILTVAHGKISHLSLLERPPGYTTDRGVSAFSASSAWGRLRLCMPLPGIAWQLRMKGEGVAVLRSRYCVAWKGSRTPNTPAECEQWLYCSRIVASSIFDSITAHRHMRETQKSCMCAHGRQADVLQ